MARCMVGLAALAVASACSAAPGTFHYDQDINVGNSRGKISYQLELGDRNQARMTVSLSGRINNDHDTMRNFGQIVNECLNNRNRVVLTGSYREMRSNVTVSLDQMGEGRDTHRIRMFLNGQLNDDVLSLTGYDKYEFGERTRFRFSKNRGGGGGVSTKDVLTGLAVLATVAIIANNTKGDSGNKDADTSLVGNWSSTQDLDGTNRGRLEYRLVVRRDNTVSLEVTQRGDFDPNRVLVNKYGDVLNYLQNGDTVSHEGRLSQRGNDVTLTFDTLKYGRREESRIRATLKGKLERGRLRITEMDDQFYGNTTKMEYRK